MELSTDTALRLGAFLQRKYGMYRWGIEDFDIEFVEVKSSKAELVQLPDTAAWVDASTLQEVQETPKKKSSKPVRFGTGDVRVPSAPTPAVTKPKQTIQYSRDTVQFSVFVDCGIVLWAGYSEKFNVVFIAPAVNQE